MVQLVYEFTVYFPFLGDKKDVTFEEFNSAVMTRQHLVAEWVGNDLEGAWFASVGKQKTNRYVEAWNPAFPGAVQLSASGEVSGDVQDYGYLMARFFQRRVYVFRAERMNVSECPAQGHTVLQPNASNLPDVLNQLISTNPRRYQRLMGHIQTIFPHVTQVTASVSVNTTARIAVWSVPLETERVDLAVPLSESGTGIGQVLAMLYVVVNADLPHVIIVDEPQSFLHPGAIRKLFEILREYPRHQYVITTHSPVALSTNDTDKIWMIRREGYVSKVIPIDPKSQNDLREFLSEVGARLGDVFGADSILWVEGKTEELCFPELIRDIAHVPLEGVQILGVVSTDELGAKFANRVYDIYQRLAGGTSLLPPAVAFLFDREGRSDRERDDIKRKSGGLVHWLPRRMYENYLLAKEVIASVINEEDQGRELSVRADHVTTWFEQHGTDRKYFVAGGAIPSVETTEWFDQVHGAKILQDLFSELTQQRLAYDKVRHGLKLTRALIAQPTEPLRELANVLAELIATRH